MGETKKKSATTRNTSLIQETLSRQTNALSEQTENSLEKNVPMTINAFSRRYSRKRAVKEEVVKSICYLLALICWLLLGTLVFIGIEGFYERSVGNERHYLYLQYLTRAEKILCEKEGKGARCFDTNPEINEHFKDVNSNLTKAGELKCSLASLQLKGWTNKTKNDAFMYAISVVSTVGWGVFAPTHQSLRIITIFYAIFGLPLFGAIVVFTRDGVIALEGRIIKVKWIQDLVGSRAILVVIAGMFLGAVIIVYGLLCWRMELKGKGTTVEDLHKQLQMKGKSEWSFFTGLYYAFITISCIGFGDEYIHNPPQLVTFVKPILQFLSIVIVVALLTRAFEGVEKKVHTSMRKSINKLTANDLIVVQSQQETQ